MDKTDLYSWYMRLLWRRRNPRLFCGRQCPKLGRPFPGRSPSALRLIQQHSRTLPQLRRFHFHWADNAMGLLDERGRDYQTWTYTWKTVCVGVFGSGV